MPFVSGLCFLFIKTFVLLYKMLLNLIFEEYTPLQFTVV